MKKQENLKEKGITLVALIVTIIILLILAGILISALTNTGLFSKAKEAKVQTEIGTEKEQVQLAYLDAKMQSSGVKITEEQLQDGLDKLVGKNKAKVYQDDRKFLVLFESSRIYTIDEDGSIIDMEENFETVTKRFISQIEDENYGTEEKPYEINCIEDLVDLSYIANGIEVIDGELCEKSPDNFENKYLILNRNLSFSLELSYEDSTRTDYGDINGNGEVESLLTELTTGKGWIPIGGYINSEHRFNGNFNGNNKIISNLHIYNAEETLKSGLFGLIDNNIIKDLGVLGNIYCNSMSVGGIISTQSGLNGSNINNCYFDGKIENINTEGNTGGIIGVAYEVNINNCYSKGTIKGNDSEAVVPGTGGIIGKTNLGTIENSYNEAKIAGTLRVGGIVGSGSSEINNSYNIGDVEGITHIGGISGYSGIKKISKCYNEGKISATDSNVAGIAGTIYATTDSQIYQCYNAGIIKGVVRTGGILGYIYSSNYLTVEQCYNIGKITGTTWTAGIVGQIAGNDAKMLNCYNAGKINGSSLVAGIAIGDSRIETAKIVSCYNVGELNATNRYGVISKYGDYGVTYNSYYLESCGATDTIAVSETEEDLKGLANELDKTFTIDDEQNLVTINEECQGVWGDDIYNINNGYPILKWQEEK